MEMLQVLTRESMNQQLVYLYEEEAGHWYAYEHSAYLLSQMLNEDFDKADQYHCKSYEIILNRIRTEISILAEFPIISCSDKELVIEYPLHLS